MNLLKLVPILALFGAVEPQHGEVYAGPPPARFQGDVRTIVEFVHDLNEYCGTPPEGKQWEGCRRGITIYMPNPCLKPEPYAQIFCHEMAHANGWSKWHEY